MKFQKGKPRPEKSGRRKGTPNKVTPQIREIMEQAFEGVGGIETFIAWGKKNPTLFYPLWIKILPKNFEITGAGGGPIQFEPFNLESEETSKRFHDLVREAARPGPDSGDESGRNGYGRQ